MHNAAEAVRTEVARQLEDPVTMAMSVLIDRVRRLPADDRGDLFELIQELAKAESREDIDGIVSTMREILARDAPRVTALDPTADEGTGPRLREWIDAVGARVRAAREEAGITQMELSERSGLPQSHLSRIENGKLSPSRATLAKLADGLGRPLSDFDPSA